MSGAVAHGRCPSHDDSRANECCLLLRCGRSSRGGACRKDAVTGIPTDVRTVWCGTHSRHGWAYLMLHCLAARTQSPSDNNRYPPAARCAACRAGQERGSLGKARRRLRRASPGSRRLGYRNERWMTSRAPVEQDRWGSTDQRTATPRSAGKRSRSVGRCAAARVRGVLISRQ